MRDLESSSKGIFSSSKNAGVSGGDSMASGLTPVSSAHSIEGASGEFLCTVI